MLRPAIRLPIKEEMCLSGHDRIRTIQQTATQSITLSSNDATATMPIHTLIFAVFGQRLVLDTVTFRPRLYHAKAVSGVDLTVHFQQITLELY